MRDVVDLHTHSIASGHAYNTINEMIQAAQKQNLQILGIVEHGPAVPESCGENYFVNLKVIPRRRKSMNVLYGVELNILDFDGNIDLPDELLEQMDIVYAGIHLPCYPKEKSTLEKNTQAYLNVMKKHKIDIVSHPDEYPVDYRALVEAAKKSGVLLEVNNTSLNPVHYRFKNAEKNYRVMLEICKKLEVPIIIGSDAHVDVAVGMHDAAMKLLRELDFPEDLILNTNVERLKMHLRRPELITVNYYDD